jgi:dsDNA-specific endonuclease/ATPase MutS2
MSTRPIDSVFRVPGHTYDLYSGGPVSDLSQPSDSTASESADRAAVPATDVEQVNSELLTIAGTIEQLQRRLEQANERLADASKTESTEVEIGRLFVEAQRFSEASLAHLEAKIHEILREAEAKAQQILMEATEEAHDIRRRAQQDALTSQATARELQVAIAGFTSVNHQLLKELDALNSVLTPGNETEGDQVGRSAAPPEIV